jgi:DNA-binding PadR family transcriptional regulator
MSLKFALLGLLAESPKYGTLRRLAELGLVTRRTEPGRKTADENNYSITEKGRRKVYAYFVFFSSSRTWRALAFTVRR